MAQHEEVLDAQECQDLLDALVTSQHRVLSYVSIGARYYHRVLPVKVTPSDVPAGSRIIYHNPACGRLESASLPCSCDPVTIIGPPRRAEMAAGKPPKPPRAKLTPEQKRASYARAWEHRRANQAARLAMENQA